MIHQCLVRARLEEPRDDECRTTIALLGVLAGMLPPGGMLQRTRGSVQWGHAAQAVLKNGRAAVAGEEEVWG